MLIEFGALNDEACPLQIKGGLVSTANGRKVLSIDVKNLSEAPLDGFTFTALVFNATGGLKANRDAGGGRSLPSHEGRRVDLSMERATLTTGDRVVLAVKDVAWANESWRSIPEDVMAAAKEAVSAAGKP